MIIEPSLLLLSPPKRKGKKAALIVCPKEKGMIHLKKKKKMVIRRTCIPLHRKALALVQPRFSGTGTSIGSSSDRNLSYREKLRSGLVDIKKDDAVDLFQSMIQSRPLPMVIDFNRLFGSVAKTKQHDLVLALCKQMEMQGIAYDLYTLNIMINCFCRRQKLGFAFSVMGKMLKLGYEPDAVTFSTLIR